MQSAGMDHIIMTNLPTWTATDIIEIGAVLLVIYLVGKELIAQGTCYFFKKAIDTNYVTVLECKSCRTECALETADRRKQQDLNLHHRNEDIVKIKKAMSLMVEYNKDIPLEERAKIRDGLIS